MLSPYISIHRPSEDRGSITSADKRNRGGGKVPSPRSSTAAPPRGPVIPVYRSRENSLAYFPTSPRGSDGSGIISQLNISAREDIIVIKWPDKPLDKAPELNILVKRPATFLAYNGDCFSKLFRLLTSMCKSFNKVGDSALANFKPVVVRTDHTLEYVGELAMEYTINLKYGSQTHIGGVIVKSPSGTTVGSGPNRAVSKTSTKETSTSGTNVKERQTQQTSKHQLLKEFYERSFRTLSIMQQCMGHFKTIIFSLTFSRYAEEDLTESEAKLVRGKSIIGSCIWVVTLALQQLQEDPEVELAETFNKPNADLVELGLEMQSVISLSLHTWYDMLLAIGALERMHKKTEEVFHKQTNHFHTKAKPESDTANMAGLHMRQYRRQGEVEHLRNFKGFDPYASLLTWNNKRQGSARILYMTEYTDPDSLWLGFDTLPVEKKIPHLKEILRFIKLVFEYVRENLNKAMTDFQGHAHRESAATKLNPNRPFSYHFTGISSFDSGIESMDEILSRKLVDHEWNDDEMHEFFETDKIFLDDLDLLTLAAAVSRAILFEARHSLHVCYETCRLLDYKEFTNLQSYEKIYHKVKDAFMEEHPNQSAIKSYRFGKTFKKPSFSAANYDIDESHIELRNVAGLFRTSQYREILKNLPLYTNRLGVTLQLVQNTLVFGEHSPLLQFIKPCQLQFLDKLIRICLFFLILFEGMLRWCLLQALRSYSLREADPMFPLRSQEIAVCISNV